MKGLKRTTRKYGVPKGHRKGIYGSELLNYFEARMLIYLPSYKWVLDNITEVHRIVEKIREHNKKQDIVLIDYNTNIDFRDISKPLSHAGLVKLYIEGDYPTGVGYTPMTETELLEKKRKETKGSIEEKE